MPQTGINKHILDILKVSYSNCKYNIMPKSNFKLKTAI